MIGVLDYVLNLCFTFCCPVTFFRANHESFIQTEAGLRSRLAISISKSYSGKWIKPCRHLTRTHGTPLVSQPLAHQRDSHSINRFSLLLSTVYNRRGCPAQYFGSPAIIGVAKEALTNPTLCSKEPLARRPRPRPRPDPDWVPFLLGMAEEQLFLSSSSFPLAGKERRSSSIFY